MEKKFVLPADKVEILRQNLSHVVSLFKEVQVRLLDVDKDTGQQWVSVSSSTLIANKTEVLDKVKEYIATALCDPEAVAIPLQLDKYPAFRQPEQVVNLEKMFGVVATVDEVSRELKIKGSDINVALANSWIDENRSSLIKDLQDSDLVVPDAGSLNPSLREFALKLGYSEKDVNSVAKKFGSDVDQNKLLRELIQHKGKSSRTDPRITESTHRGGAMKTGQIVARGASAHSRGSTRATEVASAIPRGAGYPVTPYAGTQGLSSCDDSLNSLVPIVIDGSNVAMNHGNQQVFSCRGIELCVNWFKGRGHKEIYAFVPRWRTETPRPDYPISNQHILHKLASQNFVKFSPSRRVAGRNIVCYDDRFIVDLAYKLGGVIVSNDNYRDLQREHPEWRDVIENRLLMYSFAGDYFMVPDDPLGKHGPTLIEFLQKGTKSHPRICPHISRCTYGSKCRYYHPERDPKRRQELLSGKPRQVSRVSTAYDTRNQFLRDSGPSTEIPLRQQQPYQPLSSITTSQHYTYSAQPYTSYNNSICPSNENIPDKDYDHTYAKVLDMFSEDEEKVKRAMMLYCRIKDVETVIDILLNEDTS